MSPKKTSAAPVTALLDWIVTESLHFADVESPFHAHITPGDPRLVVVAGENASGKSLFVRLLAALVRRDGTLPIEVSIRERTEAGLKRAFMFGDEETSSTGAMSVKVVQGAFANLDRKEGSLLVLDEPELGLAESYAAAFGRFIATSAQTVPDVCRGSVVVTHSRPLVRALAAIVTPTFVYTTSDPDVGGVSLESWLTAPEERSVEDLLALPAVGHERFVALAALMRQARQG